jgi:uncharacterized protein YjiS (DUF1127 family)
MGSASAEKSTFAETLFETPMLHLMAHGPRGPCRNPSEKANMTITIIDQSPTPSSVKPVTARSWLTALPRLARHQIAQIMEHRRMRRDAWALLAMDDRILADIGLRRGEVEYAARYGRRPGHSSARDDR